MTMLAVSAYRVTVDGKLDTELPVDLTNSHLTGVRALAIATGLALTKPNATVLIEVVVSEQGEIFRYERDA